MHYPDITLALGPQYHHWGREARFHVKDIAARDHLIVFPYSNLINRLFFHQALRHIHYWKGEDMQVIWPRQHLNAIVPMHYRHVELYGLRLNARLSQPMRSEVERGYKALIGVDLGNLFFSSSTTAITDEPCHSTFATFQRKDDEN